MREYMTEEYKKNLVGKIFTSSDSELKQYDGLKVIEVVRELTEKDYDRELIDETDKNDKGQVRYEINTMYKVRLENNQVINIYEDEINPDYAGSWTQNDKKGIEKEMFMYLIHNMAFLRDMCKHVINGTGEIKDDHELNEELAKLGRALNEFEENTGIMIEDLTVKDDAGC